MSGDDPDLDRLGVAHIHAPQPTEARAVDDQNCPARAGDGRRCGGRRFVLTFTPWYGWDGTCFHCGARYGEDGSQVSGRANVERVRKEWRAIRFEGGHS